MSSSRQTHILVVNHAPEILELLRELLEREGYRVSTMPSDEQNSDTIAELAPDLIVIDYMWPSSGNEWTLLNLLTMDPRTSGIPVIVCTAAIRHVEEMRNHLDRMGVRVVHKPFNIDELLAVITTALNELSPGRPAQPDESRNEPLQ